MISKTFQELVSKAMKGAELNERQFWEELEDRKNLQYFTKKVIDSARGHNSRSRFSLETLMTTLSVLVINMQAKGELQPRQGFEINIFDLLSEKSESSANLEWLISLFTSKEEEVPFIDLVARIVGVTDRSDVPGSLRRSAEFAAQHRHSEENPFHFLLDEEQIPESTEMSFSLLKLKAQIMEHRMSLSEEELFAFSQLIYLLIKSHAVEQRLVKRALLYLLVLLKLLLRTCSFPHRNKLKELLCATDVIRRFPGCVGKLADEVLHMLLREMKLSGQCFRQAVQQNFSRLKEETKEELQKKVYMVSSGDIEDGELKSVKTEEGKSNHFVRLMMCISMISITEQQTNEVFSKVASLSSADVYFFYTKLVDLLDKLERVDSCENIAIVYEKATREIIKLISKASDDTLYEIPDNFYEELNTNFRNGIFDVPRPEVVPLVARSREIPFGSDEYFKALNDISCKLEGKSYMEEISLLVTGDFQEVSRVARGLNHLKRKIGKIFQIYYLPRSNNALTKYLASRDPVYSTLVHLPFVESRLLPRSNGTRRSIEGSFVMKMKLQLLEFYFYHANYQLQLPVYKVTTSTQPDEPFFFCFFLQLYPSKVPDFPLMASHKDWVSVFAGSFKPTSFEVDIEVRGVTFTGEVEPQSQHLRIHVLDIRVSCLPLPYWMGNPPSPGSKSLEVSILPFENYEVVATAVRKLSKYRKHDKREVIEAIKSQYINLSVHSLRVRAVNYAMTAYFDNESVSNLSDIELSLASRCTPLNIMTFVPL